MHFKHELVCLKKNWIESVIVDGWSSVKKVTSVCAKWLPALIAWLFPQRNLIRGFKQFACHLSMRVCDADVIPDVWPIVAVMLYCVSELRHVLAFRVSNQVSLDPRNAKLDCIPLSVVAETKNTRMATTLIRLTKPAPWNLPLWMTKKYTKGGLRTIIQTNMPLMALLSLWLYRSLFARTTVKVKLRSSYQLPDHTCGLANFHCITR